MRHEHNKHHDHEHNHHDHEDGNNAKLAASATFHCLMGCGLGEVVGIILATMIGLGNVHSIVMAEVYTPGVMNAGLGEGIFWVGICFALIAGFVAAYPVNYVLVKRGVRHYY